MFKKSGEQSARTSVPQQGRLNTILGDGSHIDGTLRVEGSVRIDGAFDGMITATETVVVGRTGFAKADLEAREILVSGRVEGKLVAADRVELQDGARVDGDVFSQSFVIADGVVFNGRSQMVTAADGTGGASGGGEVEVRSAAEMVELAESRRDLALEEDDEAPTEAPRRTAARSAV